MILISCKISSSVSAAVITIPALSSLSHTSSCHGKDGVGGAGCGRGGGGVGLSSEKVRMFVFIIFIRPQPQLRLL